MVRVGDFGTKSCRVYGPNPNDVREAIVNANLDGGLVNREQRDVNLFVQRGFEMVDPGAGRSPEVRRAE
jgi:hypothetical protein